LPCSLTFLHAAPNLRMHRWRAAMREMKQNDASLVRLDLNERRIGNEEAREIAKVLAFNITLTQLNLGDNMVGERVGDRRGSHGNLPMISWGDQLSRWGRELSGTGDLALA
jgi:hypothetical protein